MQQTLPLWDVSTKLLELQVPAIVLHDLGCLLVLASLLELHSVH